MCPTDDSPTRCVDETVVVLCIDDEPGMAETTALRLEHETERIETIVKTNPYDALDRLADEGIDCVVSDYQMPGMDGLSLLDAIRDDYPNLPFVLFTSQGSEEVASEALSKGATDYLRKGAGSDRYELLANRVTNAVESERARKRAAEIDRIQTLVRRVNGALLRAKTRESIESAVCDAIETAEPYRFAWIGRHDDSTARIEPAAWTGVPDEYFDQVTVTTDDRPTGRGPGGRAVRKRTVEVSQNVREDPDFEPWLEPAEDHGVMAVCAVPLAYGGTLYGLLVVGAARPYVFDDRERTLLGELGDDIAYALDSLRTRRQLEARRRQFDAVFNNPVVFMAILDTDGTVRKVNETALEFVGSTVEAVAGEPFPETPWWTHSERLQRDLRSWIDEAAGGDLVRFEANHVAPDGEEVTIDGVLHPVRDEAGTVVSILAAGRDISERKRSERAIERQNERLEEFASVVSHDLRNPLSVASGRLSLARKERESDHLDAVANALDRMDEIVDDVLTMARVGQAVDSARPVSLSEVATNSWETVATESADLRVVSDRTIAADPARLCRVFENLFCNSIQHGGSGVEITVGVTDDGFFVADDGPGIAADDREDVFDPGYSAAESGTGLGLNIVRQLIEAHGWEIRIADADTGARFEVRGLGSS
ncbi:hypothetical protein DJ72_11295 [Halorubrum distributum]|nr:hypothetical protein DJ72_11295 [Halorubrum distributum]